MRMRGILVVPSRHHCLGAEGSKSRAALDSDAFMLELLESRSVFHLSGDLFIFFQGESNTSLLLSAFCAEPHFDRTELKINSWNRTRIQRGSQRGVREAGCQSDVLSVRPVKMMTLAGRHSKTSSFAEETCKLA